jgi:hypothetical protein
MATTQTFSGNGNYYLEVYAYVQSQNTVGNYSTIYYRVRVYKTNGSGFWASTNMGNSGYADSNLPGNPDLWSNGNLAYDFRNGANTGNWTFAEGVFRVYHRSDGNAEYYVNAGMTLYSLGSASVATGTRALPRINTTTVPPATTPLSVETLSQTAIKYRFSGSNGDGGSPIIDWQIGYGTNPNSPQFYVGSWGTSDIGGLSPGTTYYFWSRGRNANGWGAWSTRMSARTIAGARVKVKGVWKEAVPYVKVKGVWKLAQPYVKVNGVWKLTK